MYISNAERVSELTIIYTCFFFFFLFLFLPNYKAHMIFF